MAVMILFFLLQVFRRLTERKYDDAGAGYHKQKVRHGFHLPSVNSEVEWVSRPCRACRQNRQRILQHCILL